MVTLTGTVMGYPFVNRFDTDQHVIASHRRVISEESNTRGLAFIYLWRCTLTGIVQVVLYGV